MPIISRTYLIFPAVCLCVFAHLFGNVAAAKNEKSSDTRVETLWGDEALPALEKFLDEVGEDNKKSAYARKRYNAETDELLSEYIEWNGRVYRSSKYFCRRYDIVVQRPPKNCTNRECTTAGEGGYQFIAEPIVAWNEEGSCDEVKGFTKLASDIPDDQLIGLFKLLEEVWIDMHSPEEERLRQPYEGLSDSNSFAISTLKEKQCIEDQPGKFAPWMLQAKGYVGEQNWSAHYADICFVNDQVEGFAVRVLYKTGMELIAYQIVLVDDKSRVSDVPSPWGDR